MVFLGVVGFFVFLAGSMAIAALASSVAARVSRAPVLWDSLSLGIGVVFQIVYVSALNLVRCIWFVEPGSAPFWDRYLDVVSRDWKNALMYGALFGVVGWIW